MEKPRLFFIIRNRIGRRFLDLLTMSYFKKTILYWGFALIILFAGILFLFISRQNNNSEILVFGGPASLNIEISKDSAETLLFPFTSEAEEDDNKTSLSQQVNPIEFASQSFNGANPEIQEVADDFGVPDYFWSSVLIGDDYLLSSGNPLSGLVIDRQDIITYEVKEGDTLISIANNFGIDVNTIIWANSFNSSYLKIGQQILILPVSGVIHKVKEGDTLESMAKLYSADAENIKAFNNIQSGVLLKDGELIIPGGRMPQAAISHFKKRVASDDLPNFSGSFIAPTVGWNWGIIHAVNAVDIANKCGMDIWAASEGLVVEAEVGWNSGYGNYIKIQHPNGAYTVYAHTQENLVEIGDYVEKGQKIALMGNSGKVKGFSGCHLHFEVRGAKNPLAR